MKQRTFKAGILLSALIFTALTAIVFSLAPQLGSAYLYAAGDLGDQLPNLTVEFALPLLRTPTPGGLELSADMAWWVASLWLIIFIMPWLMLIWSWQAATIEAGIRRWVLGMSLYLPLYGSILAAVFAGLIVALAPLGNQ